MLPARGDGLLGTAHAARVVGVSPATIRKWRERGWLPLAGLDERGHPLHTLPAIRKADAEVRARGIATTGIDPRRLRRAPAA